jgi:hypothetical protein
MGYQARSGTDDRAPDDRGGGADLGLQPTPLTVRACRSANRVLLSHPGLPRPGRVGDASAGRVLLMRVEPTDGPPFVLALTADELEKVFGEVRATASWRDARCYHFPLEPPAASAFAVNLHGRSGDAAIGHREAQ